MLHTPQHTHPTTHTHEHTHICNEVWLHVIITKKPGGVCQQKEEVGIKILCYKKESACQLSEDGMLSEGAGRYPALSARGLQESVSGKDGAAFAPSGAVPGHTQGTKCSRKPPSEKGITRLQAPQART